MFSVRPHAWFQRRNSEAIQNKSLREVLEYSASQNDLKTRTVLSCSDFEHAFYLLFDARMVPTQSPTLCRTGHKGRWSWRCRQNDQYPGVVSLVVCCPSSRSFWMVNPIRGSPLMPRIIGGGLVQTLAGDQLILSLRYEVWSLKRLMQKQRWAPKLGCCICHGVHSQNWTGVCRDINQSIYHIMIWYNIYSYQVWFLNSN